MPGDFQQVETQSCDLQWQGFGQVDGGVGGLDFQLVAPANEKIPLGNHGAGIRVNGDRTRMPLLNGRSVRDVIEVAVREQKRLNGLIRKPGIGTLGSVDEDVSKRSTDQKRVRVENSARKFIELYHEKDV